MARLLTAVVTSTLALIATAAPVAPPPREAAHYFPTAVGAKWVYVWNSERDKDVEVVEVVVAVEPVAAGAKLVTVGRVAADGRTYPSEKVEVSQKGVFRVGNSSGLGGFFSPWCQLKLPVRAGEAWKMFPWSDTTLVVRGVERVRVPAGEFDAVRVDQMTPQYPTTPVQTRWYARGVGKVKHTSGGLDISLKSFTPGKGGAP